MRIEDGFFGEQLVVESNVEEVIEILPPRLQQKFADSPAPKRRKISCDKYSCPILVELNGSGNNKCCYPLTSSAILYWMLVDGLSAGLKTNVSSFVTTNKR
jgi:hypothetical protein